MAKLGHKDKDDERENIRTVKLLHRDNSNATTHVSDNKNSDNTDQRRQQAKLPSQSINVKSSVQNAVAGAAAGAVAKTTVAPIERVKLLMQLRGSILEGSSGGVSDIMTKHDNNGSPQMRAWSVAREVYRKEGILAFWRGNTPNVIRQGGAAALNFMLMDTYKIAITPIMNLTLNLPSNRPHFQRKKRRTLLSSFLSGGLAGGTTTTVLYPIEFLRTRLAMDTGYRNRMYPNGMRDVFCGIWKTDGVRGLYQGFGIALGGVMLYRALHLGGYDACKTELVHRRQYGGNCNRNSTVEATTTTDPNVSLSFMERFAIAQIVSITAGTICYPLDTVRRNLMMQAGRTQEERLYRNSLHAFQRIFVEEGLRGFYFGIGPNLVRSVGGAMLLVSYDAFKGIP